MDVKQIYDFVNTAVEEALGESGLVAEDLSNVVDVGNAVFNANAVDRYVKAIINKIGKTIVVNRPYGGGAPKGVLRDGWEFGSVLEKIAVEIPTASSNQSWELTDGVSYDPNIFVAPKVYAKFYNERTTFEIKISIAEMQVKQSFTSATQLGAFVSAIYTSVENALTIMRDELIMKTINNMTAETLYSEYSGSGYGSDSKVKAVNLLYLYNQTLATPITSTDALTDPGFVRFASYILNLYASRMRRISTLFNVGGRERFTPDDRRITVLHSDFVASAKAYLYATTFNDEFSRLPDNYSEVPYWQGSGTGYDFTDTSKLDVVTAEGHTVQIDGIIGVMFDRDALGVTNEDRRVTQNWNPVGEFINSWYKQTCGYFNDFNENFVCFFIKDAS